MIHCDKDKISISGTKTDIMVDILQIVHELVKADILDQEETRLAFVTDAINSPESKYGGN